MRFYKTYTNHMGGYSQIATELILIDQACKTGKYDYYHLLSGQDLPLKSQDEIHAFFEEHKGKEYLRFYGDKFEHGARVHYYWLLQEICGRNELTPVSRVQSAIVAVQKAFHVRRGKEIRFQKGSNWFSITDDFARYVLSRKDWIKRNFRFTYCADEIFMQTILYNSPFLGHLYHDKFDNDMNAIMRLIIWENRGPHIFTIEDTELISRTNMLFGRKFDVNFDREIVKCVMYRIERKE